MILSLCISSQLPALAENEANAGNKAYEEVYSNDFENADPVADTTISEGDDVNTTKFKTMATQGNFDIKPTVTVADEMVIDFRLKEVPGTGWSKVTAIFERSWNGLVTECIFDGNMAGYNSGWTYYRLYIDSDQATSLDDVEFKVYKSVDGLSWAQATSKRFIKKDNASASTDTSRFSSLNQLRFTNAYVDDIKIYKCGTAPEAKDAKVVIGENINASYNFSLNFS